MQVTNIGKLSGGRNNAVLLGALAAVIAAILLIVFVSAYRDNGSGSSTVVTAFVAKKLIPKGTTGAEIASKALYTPTQVEAGQLRAGAITDPSLMAGRTLQADVFPGSQIADSDFNGTTAATGAIGGAGVVSSSLTGVRRAVTVTVDPINGSLSQVATGDRVDIYQQLESGGSRIIKLLRADVPILLNDGSGNVVLDVPAADAPDVLFASKNTELLFSIRPASGAKPTLPRTANNETMLRYDRTH